MNKSLLAAILLALSLSACNSEKPEVAATAEVAPVAAPAAAEAAPATPLSAEDAEKEKIRKQNAAAEAALSGH